LFHSHPTQTLHKSSQVRGLVAWNTHKSISNARYPTGIPWTDDIQIRKYKLGYASRTRDLRYWRDIVEHAEFVS
jgi:hypothetical protein